MENSIYNLQPGPSDREAQSANVEANAAMAQLKLIKESAQVENQTLMDAYSQAEQNPQLLDLNEIRAKAKEMHASRAEKFEALVAEFDATATYAKTALSDVCLSKAGAGTIKSKERAAVADTLAKLAHLPTGALEDVYETAVLIGENAMAAASALLLKSRPFEGTRRPFQTVKETEPWRAAALEEIDAIDQKIQALRPQPPMDPEQFVGIARTRVSNRGANPDFARKMDAEKLRREAQRLEGGR